jgi:AcrR family transcriptional regulator
VARARSRKPAEPEAAGLSKDAVLSAAMQLIDANGLDAFSMRALAEHLNVYPTAIYWYVPNKNALLAEIVHVALSALAPQSPPAQWESFLTDLFHGYRAIVRKHPNIAALMGAQLVSNAGASFKIVDNILEALSAAGFEGDALLTAYDVVIAAKVGFVTMEFGNLPDDDAARWADAMQDSVRTIDKAAYPYLHKHKARLINRHFVLRWENGVTMPLDRSFAAYVDATINGLKQLPRR